MRQQMWNANGVTANPLSTYNAKKQSLTQWSRTRSAVPTDSRAAECDRMSHHYNLWLSNRSQRWSGASSVCLRECPKSPLATRIPMVPSLSMSWRRCIPKETARQPHCDAPFLLTWPGSTAHGTQRSPCHCMGFVIAARTT